jgi:SPP1 family predicted phage head-tail adaptor
MRAGDMDRRITVQSFTATLNNHGEKVKSWSDVGTFWAKLTPQRVMESFRSQQELAQAERGYRVRWNSTTKTIDPKMRLEISNNDSPETFTYWEILGTQLIDRNEGIDILVRSNVA